MAQVLSGSVATFYKKKVLLHSNYPGMKTGFGGFMREMCSYLHKTGKYEIAVLGAGITFQNGDFARWPWKTYGTLPNDKAQMDAINADPNQARMVNYGALMIDRVIQDFKPDVYIGIEDPWGIDFCRERKWWGKIPCVVHTTIDSRPLLDQVIKLAKSTPYFFSWADFATQEFHKLGINHVRTLRGTVNTDVYRKLSAPERKALRDNSRIPQDAFCIGMLSRNQLRKGFPNLIEGYKLFKDRNPQIKNTRLLLFTHFSEGWNIPRFCQEIGVDPNEVLAAYKCRSTNMYFIAPFQGQDLNNPVTGHEKSLVTVNIHDGLTEEQVNEWYNLLDVYCHPFTSGGQERAIQEAKLAERITLVTNYSCGEDSCEAGAGSLPLSFTTYREPGTEFIKANTSPNSIASQLEKVHKMDARKRDKMAKQGREWVLKNFSIEVVGKQFEELIDRLPKTNYDFVFTEELKDPTAAIPANSDDREWLKTMYRDILKMDVQDEDEGLRYWLQQISNGVARNAIENFFRNKANEENAQADNKPIGEMLPGTPDERLLITMPESLGDCLYLTSLLRDARELYHDKKIFVATKPAFREVFLPLVGKYIDFVVDWIPQFDNPYILEGAAGSPKIFDIVLCPHFPTQRMINYLHNGHDRSKLNLKYE